jgi:hypothetical protein
MLVELQHYRPRVRITYGRFPLGIPFTLFVCFTPHHHRDTVQTVNLGALSTEDRIRSQATNGICYGKSGTWVGFCLCISVFTYHFPCTKSSMLICLSPTLHNLSKRKRRLPTR